MLHVPMACDNSCELVR